MGAITVSSRTYDIAGSRNLVFGSLALSNSYATGGDTFTAANFGLGTVDQLRIYSGGGYSFQVDLTNKKVKAYLSAGFTPAGTVSAPTITTSTNAGTTAPMYTNAGALTQTTGGTGITGVQAPAFTGTAVAAAALTEVGATTDLSGTSLFYEAVGV